MAANKDTRTSFVFFRSWLEVVPDLDDAEELALYRAIMAHAFGWEMPQLNRTMNLVLKRTFAEIDDNKQRFEDKCQKRREAGRKGGKSTQDKAKQANQAIASSAKANQAKQANQAENENENENEKYILDNNPKGCVVNAPAQECKERINYSGIIQYWNGLVKGSAIPSILEIEGNRRVAVRSRFKEDGKLEFANILKRAAESPVLRGGSKQHFVACFDWVIKKQNWQKIKEGNFDHVFNDTVTKQPGREDISTKDFEKF